MAKRRTTRQTSLAEVVQGLPAARGVAEPWVQPIRVGRWVDAEGTRWEVRRSLSLRRIERLLGDTEIDVLLCYGSDPPSPVPFAERTQLWERALPYLEGRPRPRSDHADFAVAEFRNGERSLVIFEESC